MSDDLFYSKLNPLKSFLDSMNFDSYLSLPDSWLVALTDVRGSTKAIEQGRYRDVNVLGASSLIAVLNALKGLEVPYVFGGDGATIAFPNQYKSAVILALKGSQRLARQKFNLELRAGIVPVRLIREMGSEIQVAKLEVGPTACVALFRGGGCSLADSLLKDDLLGPQYRVEISPDEAMEADFTGLQCRWDPISAKSGTMVTLLLAVRAEKSIIDDEAYRRHILALEQIVGQIQCPVQRSVLESQILSKWVRSGPKEAQIQSLGKTLWQSLKGRLQIVFEMAAFRYMLVKGKKGQFFDPERYLNEVPTATDYRKFDDTLRMVFECPREKVSALIEYLEGQAKAGNIYYGLHRSDSALMTCLVFNYERHLHLIDGSDGGYTSAAKQLKAQLKAG